MDTRKLFAKFCGVLLRTMDPERAADACGLEDGYAVLARKNVMKQLDLMRQSADSQLRRDDAVRRLAQLAFGGANDAVALALRPQELDPRALDLSAVTEFRVTDKGGVEVKLADRVKALETLCSLLDKRESGEFDALCQALDNAAGAVMGGDSDGDG